MSSLSQTDRADMRLELPSPPVSGYTTPTGHEDRPFFYPSATSTAVNTPSGLEDKPFLFPSNALAKYASRLSERSDNGDEEKGRESEKEKEEEDNGLESRRPSDVVGELESYPIPEKKALTKVRMAILGLVMMSTTFVASATSASTLLVIPSIAKDLGITELQAQWITSAYSLANGCGLLLAGRVADLYGKKWLYMLGMIAYLVLSIVSGIIRNYVAICVVRAFAGLAISISLPAAFGIIGVTFDAEPYRTMAFSALALGYPVGGGPGMIIAGLVAGINHRAWQYTFFILAGMALVPIVLGFFTIPNDKVKATPGGNRKIDWLGAFLITVALCLFTFALTQSGLTAKGWGEPYIGTCVALSVLLMIAFGFWEHIAETRTSIPPLVHLGIFSRHNWKVTSVLLLSFFGYTAISGWLYLVTIWYQNLKGDRPIMNAVHILPAPIVGMIACILVPMLAPRVKACYLLMLGGMCTATAQLLFAVAPVDLTYWACEFLSNIFTPFGADFTVGIGSVLISNLVSEDQQAVGGALFQTALQIASTVGVCISSLTETIITEQSGSLEKGLKDAFWMMAAFSWASMIIAFVTLRKTGLAKDIGKTQL